MNRLLAFILIILASVQMYPQFSASGTHSEYAQNIGGIQKVYVYKSVLGAALIYTSPNPNITFYTYQYALGDKIALASGDISKITMGGSTTYTITNLIDSRGYLASETSHVAWVTDYSQHRPQINSIVVAEDANTCDYIKLVVDKSDDLSFYSGGVKRDIVRQYKISYQTMEWDEAQKKIVQVTKTKAPEAIGTDVSIDPAPYIDTQFTITGDQFGEEFGNALSAQTTLYHAVAVTAKMRTEQEARDNANEVGESSANGLGGSAPVTIHFKGNGNTPLADFYTWFIYNTKDLKNPVARYTDKDITYEFANWGTYRVVFEVANRDASCLARDSVDFKILESWMDVPNYFSPGDSPGSNDEFRVAYRSIVKFKGVIFSRWGVKLFEWNDPAKGWDGKYKGSYVTPGVYFYVIEATGSDGEKHLKKGDINIVRSR